MVKMFPYDQVIEGKIWQTFNEQYWKEELKEQKKSCLDQAMGKYANKNDRVEVY